MFNRLWLHLDGLRVKHIEYKLFKIVKSMVSFQTLFIEAQTRVSQIKWWWCITLMKTSLKTSMTRRLLRWESREMRHLSWFIFPDSFCVIINVSSDSDTKWLQGTWPDPQSYRAQWFLEIRCDNRGRVMSWKTGLLKQTENGSATQMLMISPVKPCWQTFCDLKVKWS